MFFPNHLTKRSCLFFTCNPLHLYFPLIVCYRVLKLNRSTWCYNESLELFELLTLLFLLPLQQWRGQQASAGQPDFTGWQRKGKWWQSGGLRRGRRRAVQRRRFFHRPIHSEEGQGWDGGQRELRGHFTCECHLLAGIAAQQRTRGTWTHPLICYDRTRHIYQHTWFYEYMKHITHSESSSGASLETV